MLEVEQAAAALQWGLLEQQPEGTQKILSVYNSYFPFTLVNNIINSECGTPSTIPAVLCGAKCVENVVKREIFHASFYLVSSIASFCGI